MTRTEPGQDRPTASWGAPWEPAVRALERHRPPLPRFRSPLRGPWLTSVFGVVLLAALPVVIVTGLLSYVAYGPQFGQAIPGDVGVLHLPWFDWPASPSWLYRLTQGLHVGLGLVLVPVVLAKLWSVAPKLFAWPPVRSPAQALERLSLLLLVGGILFEIVTGLLNIQYDYVFGFSFYAAHYVGAWVFLGAFVAHVALKLPHMVRGLRSRSLRAELRTPTLGHPPRGARRRPRPGAPTPAPPTMSRRGALALVGGGSLLVAALTAGQTLGGPLRSLAVLLPRGRNSAAADGGPNDFPVNKTFAVSGIEPGAVGATWRLDLTGGAAPVRLDRDALAAQPQHTATLPIACVEGWSTTQTWTGVRLRDLAALAGVPAPASAVVRSLENGPFAQATLTSGPGAAPGRAARARRQRRAARAGPRLPGPGRRPGAARRAQHQVGPLDRVPELLMRHRLEALYGAGPGHLAVLLLSVAVAGYAASIVAGDPLWPWMAVWFVAAVVVHDGLLSPLAAVADAVLRFCLRWFPRVPPDRRRQLHPGAGAGGRADVPDVPAGHHPAGRARGRRPDRARPEPVPRPLAAAGRRDGGGVRAGLRGAPAHQTVSSRWLTASASSAWAASHMRGRGSSAHGTTSHTANGNQIRSTSALDSPVRSATTTAASAASTSSAAGPGRVRVAAARRTPA